MILSEPWRGRLLVCTTWGVPSRQRERSSSFRRGSHPVLTGGAAPVLPGSHRIFRGRTNESVKTTARRSDKEVPTSGNWPVV